MQLSRIRLVWGFRCQGCHSALFVLLLHSFVRPASRAFFRPDRYYYRRRAQRGSRTALLQRRRSSEQQDLFVQVTVVILEIPTATIHLFHVAMTTNGLAILSPHRQSRRYAVRFRVRSCSAAAKDGGLNIASFGQVLMAFGIVS